MNSGNVWTQGGENHPPESVRAGEKEEVGSHLCFPWDCGKRKLEVKYITGLLTLDPNIREQVVFFNLKSKAEEYEITLERHFFSFGLKKNNIVGL